MKKSNVEKNTSKKQESAKPDTGKAGKKGKTAKELMTRHISKEDDVISDEDFKNLNIEIDTSGDVTHEPLDIPESSDRPKDEDKDPKVVTPWDVIS